MELLLRLEAGEQMQTVTTVSERKIEVGFFLSPLTTKGNNKPTLHGNLKEWHKSEINALCPVCFGVKREKKDED